MSESPVKRARVDVNEDLPLDLSMKRRPTGADPQEPQNPPNYPPENSSLIPEPIPPDIPTRMLSLEYSLTKTLQGVLFRAPVEYLYSPIEYAFSVHLNYLKKFCNNEKKILFLGMNPGPWGMSQTGVPFGEVNTVVNWLGLSGNVDRPPREQPDRRVQGLLCKRSDVSGKRFWELFKRLCCTPEVFFRHSFLRNYCPVALMDAGGRNITPAELKATSVLELSSVDRGEGIFSLISLGVLQRPEQTRVVQLCDWFLGESVKALRAEVIVGVGRFAEKRARHVVKTFGLSTQVFWMPHPSPRSTGTQDWSTKAQEILQDLNLLKFFSNEANPPAALVIPPNSERGDPQMDGRGPLQG
ncbi:single-strand selective monofunctional uracil DNA glycosylase [Diachasma alloeum]|uniref:single-strand selective monofunctional uracil DNA glycosylase n=1 Tax=Diachasma alloeum TaxID=454923 RepID=UPI0010FB8652|nr:single-strand selective monofunctional uracil DNA glycosylase [Diachasma alloeum]